MASEERKQYLLEDGQGIQKLKWLTGEHLAVLLANGWVIVEEIGKRDTAVHDLHTKAGPDK
jgi:hypothetical protein